MGSWPSGRWQQTVNLPSESYNVSSNLSLPASMAQKEIRYCEKHGNTEFRLI